MDRWKEGQALFLEFLKSHKFILQEGLKELAINYADSQEPAHHEMYIQLKGRLGLLDDLIELDFDMIEQTEEQARELKESYGK